MTIFYSAVIFKFTWIQTIPFEWCLIVSQLPLFYEYH